MIRLPAELEPGQRERAMQFTMMPEARRCSAEMHDRVHQESPERHPVEDRGVVVQGDVADREECLDRVRSPKIWRSGLKQETNMNTSGRPNTRQSRIRRMQPADQPARVPVAPGLGGARGGVRRRGRGSSACSGSAFMASLSRVR